MPKKRKDGRYAKQVTVGIKNGKPIKKTVYGKTVKELDKNFRDLMILVDRGVILDSQSMTVKELYEEWYRIKKEGKVRVSTEFTYKINKKKIIEAIGDMKVKDVKKYNIESIVNELLKRGCTSKAKAILGVLKAIFNYAVENDIVVKNPCVGMSVKYEPNKRRILTQEETQAIDQSNLAPKEKAILYLLRFTGMRRNEMFALQKSDIDKESMTIHVCKTVVENGGRPFIQEMTKTDAGDRYIPIFLRLAKPLYDYIDVLDLIDVKISKEGDKEVIVNDVLFLNKASKLISTNSQKLLFDKIVKEVGIGTDLTMHCFRHNFISECYSAKVDIKKVQSWVGHDDVGTTLNIYTKLSKQEVQDGEIMNEYYNSQTEVKSKLKKIKTP